VLFLDQGLPLTSARDERVEVVAERLFTHRDVPLNDVSLEFLIEGRAVAIFLEGELFVMREHV
jgi:hypothetical protein